MIFIRPMAFLAPVFHKISSLFQKREFLLLQTESSIFPPAFKLWYIFVQLHFLNEILFLAKGHAF